MNTVIFIICIILVIITNIIWFYRGIKVGMNYSLNKTYDIFMQAMYMKLRKDNKSEEEAKSFMHDVHNLLNIASEEIL